MGLIKQLRRQKDFTEVEMAIADYIIQNQDAMQNMGIVDLARNTYSSNAAIIRMCRKLGLSGYKEFRIAFAADLEKNRIEQTDVEVNYPFTAHQSVNAVMKSVADISREAINTCYTSISPGKMDRAARILRKANRIFLYAAGDSYTTSIAFSNMLMKLGRTIIYPALYFESAQQTYNATSEDAALIISYSGRILNSITRELQILKRNGTPIILISTLQEYPGLSNLIEIPDKEQVVGKAAGYYSQTAIRFILNCLYGEIYSLDISRNQTHKDKADAYAYDGNGIVK